MSTFNAGEIVAKLKLDRTQFNLDLDRAKADVEEKFGKAQEVEIKPVLDDKAMAEVLAEEEPLRADIEPEVKPTYVKGSAESVGRTIAADILTGVERSGGVSSSGAGSGPISGLIGALLGQGLNQQEIGSALKNLKFSGEEIKLAMESALIRELGGSGSGDSLLASAIVHSILPSASEMDGAFSSGVLALGPIGSTGQGNSGMALQIVESMLPAVPAMNTALTNYMHDMEGQMGKGGGGVRVATDFRAAFMKWLGAGSGDGGGGFFQTLFSGPGGPFAALSGGSGIMGSLMNPIGASAGVAFLGAFGAAISGGIAATIIGSAGTMAALLPGFLDLMKGYQTYSTIKSGGSTKGMSPSQIGLGKAIGGLVGSGSKGLGSAEATIMPQIEKFIKAIQGIMPLISGFAKPAIGAMTGFFDAIDKGMNSKNFKIFMQDMSSMVGPIMKDFGKVLLNLGGALGGFLKLFGKVGETKIGPWFVKVTGELDHFLNHVKLGHGFVNGMVTVFSNLGKILGAAWTAIKLFGTALAPVGLQVFRIAGWLGEWAGRIIKLVPPWLITAIVGLVLAFKALSIIMGIVNIVMDANPVVLIGLAILALVVIVYGLVKHWKTVWKEIKRLALDAWHFLDNDVFHPIGDFFVKIFTPVLNTFSKLWGDIWKGISDAVSTVWGIIKPIFDLIKGAIKDITGAIGAVTGIAGKVGGAVLNAIPGGGLIKSIASGVGNFFSHPFGLAGGGVTQANKLQLVGEQGPELFVPSTSGTIIPNGRFGGQGQHIIFQIDARGHANPTAISTAVRSAIGTTIPALQAALARGAA